MSISLPGIEPKLETPSTQEHLLWEIYQRSHGGDGRFSGRALEECVRLLLSISDFRTMELAIRFIAENEVPECEHALGVIRDAVTPRDSRSAQLRALANFALFRVTRHAGISAECRAQLDPSREEVEREEFWSRTAAVRSLGMMGDIEAVDAITENIFLRHDRHDVLPDALRSLGMIGEMHNRYGGNFTFPGRDFRPEAYLASLLGPSNIYKRSKRMFRPAWLLEEKVKIINMIGEGNQRVRTLALLAVRQVPYDDEALDRLFEEKRQWLEANSKPLAVDWRLARAMTRES